MDPGGLYPNGLDNLSLQVRNTYNTIYFENGICKCPGTSVGDTETINGVTYTVVDNSTIQGQINSGNVNLCTTLVTNMSNLFQNNTSFNSNIGFWDTSNVTNMSGMFDMSGQIGQFNQDISNWDTSSVTDMNRMFQTSIYFNQDISSWDTSSVTNMSAMFAESSAFNQNISGWDTSSVTSMGDMFAFASNFNQPIGDWDVSNVANMNQMFINASDFNQDLTNWCVTNITSEPSSFSSSSALTSNNKPIWGTCPGSITVSLTSSYFNNTVTTGIVTITSTFSSPMNDTPLISISGLVVSALHR